MFNSLPSREAGYCNASLIRRIDGDFVNDINEENAGDINEQNAGDINSDYNSLSDNIVNRVLKPR
jgi:hypothetical protein